MGKKGGGSTTVQSYQPTEEEKKLWRLQGEYEDAIMPGAIELNNKAAGLLENSLGDMQVDYTGLLNDAQKRNQTALNGLQSLANGELPQNYIDNMQQTISAGVNDSMGSLLNNLGASGVLNSSVTSKGVQDINNAAANAMANAYNSNISQVSNIYGNLLNNAGTDITTAAAAQEAAQQPALNLWNASIGLDGTNTAAISALGGKGSTTSTVSGGGGGGIFGGILAGLAGNSGLFCFPGNTKVKTPSGLVQIKDIKEGDIVVSPVDESSVEVKEVMNPRFAATYTIVASGGAVTCTKSQPIMKEDGEWETVAHMTVGMKLKGKGEIRNIIYSGDRKVYDLKVDGDSYYADGFTAKAGTEEW